MIFKRFSTHYLLFIICCALLGAFFTTPSKAQNPLEKVYLHTDKPFYLPGDTIWFKAYVTLGSQHQLSAWSGALYVELIDQKDSLLRSLKLPISAGTSMGDFSLDHNDPPGNYRLRAYTQWMRNVGEACFFEKLLRVDGPAGTTSPPSGQSAAGPAKNQPAAATQLSALADVQFFPEGGSLVNGISTRMAFKAIGTDGLGLPLKGILSDQSGKEINKFETLRLGMGSFVFTPEHDKSYVARLMFSDGSEKNMPLPAASDEGYVLGVYQPNKDSILVRINIPSAHLTAENQEVKQVQLMVQAGQEILFDAKLNIAKRTSSIWLDKSNFPSGIVRFTLLGKSGEPLNERLLFIRKDDAMKLRISAPQQKYSGREPVQLELDARNSAGKGTAGTFSISVVNEDQVSVNERDESTIFSYLLLSSELRGYIEQANSYFINENDTVVAALDNLMLSQGYRQLVWKAGLPDSSIKPLYPVEKLSSSISGRVLTLNNKPAAGAKVMLMANKAGILESRTADANGHFSFEDLVLSDSIRFTLQARTDKNSNKVILLLDSLQKQLPGKRPDMGNRIVPLQETPEIYKTARNSLDSVREKSVQLSTVQRLREVNIKTAKKEAAYASQGLFRIPDGHSDQTFVFKDAERCVSLLGCLQGMLHGVVFKESGSVANYPFTSRGDKMQVILDGNLLSNDIDVQDLFDQATLLPEDIVKIEVVRTNQALISLLGQPSIMIYTRRGLVRKSDDPSVINFMHKGFNKVREFYSPRYDRPGSTSSSPDERSTVYWNPNVKTYGIGKATLGFFNADGPGNYKVTIEGINADGELGRTVYRYAVSAGKSAAKQPGFAKEVLHLRAATDSLRKKLPAEKIYLHTDKHHYNIGDTLWFKAYLLDAAGLSASRQSSLLYVELYDDSAEVVRRISVPVKNGNVWAQIPLSAKIFREGGYTLRAYTNWQQNFGSDYEFKKRLYLGLPGEQNWLVKSSPKITRVQHADQLQVDLRLTRADQSPVALRDLEVLIYEGSHYLYKEKLQTSAEGTLSFAKLLKEKTDVNNLRVVLKSLHEADGGQLLTVPVLVERHQKIDLQFLPEGGHIVAGINTLMGFKAIGEDGKAKQVSGRILDKKGNDVSVFSSLANGMGSFNFIPQVSEKYTAILLQPERVETVFELPAVVGEGTVLHIKNEQRRDVIEINISASPNALHADSTYYLVGMSRGLLSYAEKLIDPEAKLEIPKMRFPSGVTKFTLLRGRQPLNERMVFIDHQDQFQITVKPQKSSYQKRDSVALDIEVKDKSGMPVNGNFSIAITDDSQLKADEQGDYGIMASLLVNSELKGKIEHPGYYLNRKDSTTWQALDHLMLTQGWTGYDWKDVFNPPQPKFKAEQQQEIAGRVTNLLKKPVANSQVLISSQKPSFIHTVFTDKEGHFAFRNLPQIDSGSFFIQAKTAAGKTKNFGAVELERMQFPEVPETYRDKILPWYVNNDTTMLNYVKLKAAKLKEESLKQSGIALNEVKITSKKIIKNSMNRNGPGKADLIFDEKDIKESAVLNLYELMRQKLPGLKVVYEDGFPTLKLNDYMVVVEVDGGGLPIDLDVPFKREQLIAQLSQFQIATFKGMEVMYSRDFMRNYAFPPPREPFKGEQIANSEIAFSTGSGFYQPEGLPGVGKVDLDGPFYKSGYRGGYLEARVNVLTNKVREIAVVGITTGNERGWFKNERPDFATYRPVPLMKAAEFYSPKYAAKSADEAEPDYRSTLYWEPNVITDANGRARVFFYTSDIKGNYTITIEGADFKGGIGSLRYSQPF